MSNFSSDLETVIQVCRQSQKRAHSSRCCDATVIFSGQVTLAQEAEVMFATKRELSQLREQNKELLRSLSASEEQISELKLKKQVEIIVLDKFKLAAIAINSMPDSEILSGFILL